MRELFEIPSCLHFAYDYNSEVDYVVVVFLQLPRAVLVHVRMRITIRLIIRAFVCVLKLALICVPTRFVSSVSVYTCIFCMCTVSITSSYAPTSTYASTCAYTGT